MQELILEPSKKAPGVRLSGNVLLFYGRSMITDTTPFFAPVFDWTKEYLENPNETTELTIKLDYINAASIQSFLALMKMLRKVESEGHTFTINWYYQYGDLEMLQLGVILQGRLDKEFELHEFEPHNSGLI